MPKVTLKAKTPDAEMLQFMADLEQSLCETKAGQYARVHTPEQILARRRGRPVGSVQVTTKEALTSSPG